MDNRDEELAGPRAVWRIVRRRDFGPYFLGNALSAPGRGSRTSPRLC
jgi:hypothetical protein